MKETLEKYEETVKKATKIRPLSAKGWASGVPKESGVYVIWEADIPIYVGETSSLKLRMSDLARPVNHSFSKKVAEMLSIADKSYTELATAMAARYSLSYVEVAFGRKEIEEYLILRWRNSLINKPTTRLLHSAQYNWVKPSKYSGKAP